jgi:hypothetical protein
MIKIHSLLFIQVLAALSLTLLRRGKKQAKSETISLVLTADPVGAYLIHYGLRRPLSAPPPDGTRAGNIELYPKNLAKTDGSSAVFSHFR